MRPWWRSRAAAMSSFMMRAACRLTSGAPQYTLGHDSDSTETSMPTVSIILMRAG